MNATAHAEFSGFGLRAPEPVRILYKRPPLYDMQERAIFSEKRYAWIEASTKSGKTVGCIAWIIERALFEGGPGRNFWWVAPIFPVAKIAFRRVKLALRRSMPRNLFRVNESELSITLINGAALYFRGADKPDSLYGEDVHAVVIDEASRCKEEAFHAVRSTLTATRGPIRVIGNVKGKRNWFFKNARKAENDNLPNDHYARITCYDAIDAGVLDAAEIEDARQKLPEKVFAELYETEASDDGTNPFGVESIRACIAPLADAAPEVWGWDLAKSVDYTVGIGLDKQGRVCNWDRFQRPWNETLKRIQEKTARAAALVDSTGVGDPIVETLQRDLDGVSRAALQAAEFAHKGRNGTNGHKHKGEGKADEEAAPEPSITALLTGRVTRRNFHGFKFSSASKQMIMEGLAVAIQKRLITFPDGPIVQELEAFEFEYTRTGVRYAAPEGFHDDCVCALALAWHQLSHKPPRDMIF